MVVLQIKDMEQRGWVRKPMTMKYYKEGYCVEFVTSLSAVMTHGERLVGYWIYNGKSILYYIKKFIVKGKHFVNGKLHNLSGPAVVYANGTRSWFVGGKRHRIGGPAIIYSSGNEEYWEEGEMIVAN